MMKAEASSQQQRNEKRNQKRQQNHSAAFARAISTALDDGRAELVSTDPPIYIVHDLLSATEASMLLGRLNQRRQRWLGGGDASHHPLACFENGEYQRDAALQPFLVHGLGRLGRVSCLNQSASRAVAPFLPHSESMAVYRGEEALLDMVGRRLHARAGLRPTSALPFQLLTYDAGTKSEYHPHTDCAKGDTLSSTNRMATVLLSLNTAEYEGGETEFTRLGGMRLKPPVGSALLFYSHHHREHGFNGHSQHCDLRTEHRARAPTRGVKHVLQRWYAFREEARLDFRPVRSPSDLALRRPWQPVIKCMDTSCRWYAHPHAETHDPKGQSWFELL